jgi:hypothetical protein
MTICFSDITVDHIVVADIPRTIKRATIAPVVIAVSSHPATANLAEARRPLQRYQFRLHVELPRIVPNTNTENEADLDYVRRNDLPNVLALKNRNVLDLQILRIGTIKPIHRRANMKLRSISLPSLIMFALHPISFHSRNSY